MQVLFTRAQWAGIMATAQADIRAAGLVDDVAKIVVAYTDSNPGPIAFAKLEPIILYSSYGYAPPVWLIELNCGRLNTRIDDGSYADTCTSQSVGQMRMPE
jgi:hypothetical protein